MNTQTPTLAGLNRRQTLLALLGAAGLSACGGGGSDGVASGGSGGVASVGGGGTGSFAVGPITGLGSIIVNGVRYDDSSASISNDDSSFRREDLRLGMVVAVQGSPAVNGQSTATRIVLGAELVGPITSKTADGFEVLGQTVSVTANTFYDPSISGGLAGLTVGQAVEVHGIADPATNSIKATYVERKSSPSEYRIQGRITAHDATAKTFSIGSLQLDYSATATSDVRVTPAVGTLVRVRLGTTAAGSGAYPVTRIRKPEDSFSGFSGEVEFKGTITAFTSPTRFSVNDLPVDASSATFPKGTGGVVAGAFVEIKGSLVNGVVVATRVQTDDDGAPGTVGTEFELHGLISAATTSGSGGSFTLTSSGGVAVTVDWSSGIEFRKGTAANLVNGRHVEVKGTLGAGSAVTATRISFED